jgi:homoaconitase/3-isopropylmalate dehydratase large subunit
MIVVGSDLHTCSAGALGCLAIGTGAADATIPLVTGETWFKVTETINNRFVGDTVKGMLGRETMLYVLQQLKQTRAAVDRIVEISGPRARDMTCDMRFTICNMTQVRLLATWDD